MIREIKILPAIDIKNNKCVRLIKGDFDNKPILCLITYANIYINFDEKHRLYLSNFLTAVCLFLSTETYTIVTYDSNMLFS